MRKEQMETLNTPKMRGLTDNFDKHKKAKGENPAPPDNENFEEYYSAGNGRNLCFIQPDGERLFLNYAYLISGEFSPKENTITLTYTTHSVNLKGHHLEKLLDDLMSQKTRKIICIDERYLGTKDKMDTVVTKITIREKS